MAQGFDSFGCLAGARLDLRQSDGEGGAAESILLDRQPFSRLMRHPQGVSLAPKGEINPA
jgi:hypothetical protein